LTVSTRSTDRPTAADIADFESGYKAAMAEVDTPFNAAMDAGAEELSYTEAAEALAKLVNQFMNRPPAGASRHELEGRFRGVLEVLGDLCFGSVLTLSLEPRKQVR
jgi:hypothetical protein